MDISLSLFGVGILLVFVQVLAAVPWFGVAVLGRDSLRYLGTRSNERSSQMGRGMMIGISLAGILIVGAMLSFALSFLQDKETLESLGRVYAALLHLQLIADAFVLVFFLLLTFWPKGGAVALAAFREGVRQPMFWLLLGLAFLFLIISPFIPYFTFGEDLVMLKEMGYDAVMLAALAFGVIAASNSISEEIEGRTAITLMSKPVSRRQFLLGKFVGIFLSALVMVGLLGWVFNWIVIYKQWFDRADPVPTPALLADVIDAVLSPGEAADYLRGAGLWVADALENLPGLILGSCQVMVLLAVAVALATRLPFVVNLVVCLMVYFLGHLSPVLSEIARSRLDADPNAAGNQMLSFVATLFYNILPGLEFFSVGPALVTDSPPPMGDFYKYVGMVTLYGVLYTLILLLVGLVLFEDRDLA